MLFCVLTILSCCSTPDPFLSSVIAWPFPLKISHENTYTYCHECYFWVPKEKAFQSQIGSSYCFRSPRFFLISTVLLSFTPMPLVTHWSASLTLQPVPVCVCKLITEVRDYVRIFRLSLTCGTAAGYAVILEYFGRGKVRKSKQNLKWLFSRCFNS